MNRDSAKRKLSCWAVCAPGLEALTAGELRTLGIRPGSAERGGVSFVATTRQLYAANVFLRTATRVLLRAAVFEAPSFAALQREAARVPWEDWIPSGAPVALSVSSSKSRLYHTGAVAERLAAVLPGAAARSSPLVLGASSDPDPLGVSAPLRESPLGVSAPLREPSLGVSAPLREPSLGVSAPLREPPLRVFARLVHDRCTLSVDASGEALHRRGWRLETAKAPLRETLAAAMLLASGWDGSSPLLDPFCGSGTIAIEAALLARGVAPGSTRDFAFRRWPSFEPGTFASVVGQARAAVRAARPLVVVASDRDPGAVRAARANAERAGVGDAIDFQVRALEELEAPAKPYPAGVEGGGWLLSNPPYGRRVTGELRGLFVALGDVVRRLLPGWGVGLLVADPRPATGTDLRLRPAFETSNGGIRVRFAVAPP